MTRMIPLTKGKSALVDDADYEWLTQWKWRAVEGASGNWYAECVAGRMHRLVMGITNPEVEVDHKDGDGLHNRRGNLRACSHKENMRNRKINKNSKSGFKGVRKRWHTRKFQARIRVGAQEINLGYFHTPEEAARAYDAAARENFGEFARLNFPT